MSEKRSGLGRGLGALIPATSPGVREARSTDVFFPGQESSASEPGLAVPAAEPEARVSDEDPVPTRVAERPDAAFLATDTGVLTYTDAEQRSAVLARALLAQDRVDDVRRAIADRPPHQMRDVVTVTGAGDGVR